MKENYMITIEGKIDVDGEVETVTLMTVGSYYEKNGKYYICYKDTEATGFAGCTTTLKAWDGGVSMKRYGRDANSTLIIEKGAINICNYQTVAGMMTLDINGIDIDNHLTDEGGDLSFTYSLNTGGMLLSENKVNVKVKEIN